MEKKVSVIVTAFNRTQYILDALKSIGIENEKRLEIELIVVKNFSNDSIDSYIKKLGGIIIEGGSTPLCEYAYRGIKAASGKYIFFLEDDDLFFPGKIDTVTNLMEKLDLDFYHNNYVAIDPERRYINTELYRGTKRPLLFDSKKVGKREIDKIIKIKGDINLSSMVINRKILNEKFSIMESMPAGPDWFLFLAALEFGQLLYFDCNVLTAYNIHDSAVHLTEMDFSALSEKRLRLSVNEITSLSKMKGIFYNENAVKLINSKIAMDRIQIKILTGKVTSTEDINIISAARNLRVDSLGAVLFLLYVLSIPFNGIARKAYLKIYQNITIGH